MATKHEQILQYINELPVGEKISVRQIAKALNVSEGTAYRAIKDAEIKGYVSTIERVGTIRIEQKKKENIEKLTFSEVVNIIDGQVLGGKSGLYKTLTKFVIGAMELEAMSKYTDPGSLLIVGNRTDAHELALRSGAAVLITGGFDTKDYVKKIADEKALPIISTSYDTFTVATMINRAVYDQLIKKEIILVEDILTPIEKTAYLNTTDTVQDWYRKKRETGHSRFPVVDRNLKVAGIITSKDVMETDTHLSIEKVMTKNPITVSEKTSVTSVAHMMVWEGIEILPVTDDFNRLRGIVSRQDVLKELQMTQRQPQVGETIDNIVTTQLDASSAKTEDPDDYQFEVTPQMTNPLGTISYGVFTTLVHETTNRFLRSRKKGEMIIESLTVYFIKPVQLESMIRIVPKILDSGRKFAKIDVEVFNQGSLVGKALLMCQLIER
ncbi:CBS domain-containing protein [Weizmannia agrestimuris]|uniref:CBS domain-containing protein n=1 Tax=Weizmannia agrestimuris TaxID=2941342 RepID=UPI002041421C|nr:CBS domain-containing protein [Weizmannia agrestimuris]